MRLAVGRDRHQFRSGRGNEVDIRPFGGCRGTRRYYCRTPLNRTVPLTLDVGSGNRQRPLPHSGGCRASQIMATHTPVRGAKWFSVTGVSGNAHVVFESTALSPSGTGAPEATPSRARRRAVRSIGSHVRPLRCSLRVAVFEARDGVTPRVARVSSFVA